MKSILITGGAGFIGSHTCLVLLERGYKVFVIDSFQNSSPESLKRVIQIGKLNNKYFSDNLHIFNGDLRDKNFIKQTSYFLNSNGYSIDCVIHFAGLKSVKESILFPIKYWDCNLIGTINLIQMITEFNCRNFVFSSSACIYDNESSNKAFDETSKINPNSPYGKSKFVIEQILYDLYKSSSKEWKIINLRYFNPIGAHNSGLIGEDPVGLPNNIFPLLTKVAIGQKKELEIFGKDWPTRDGTPIRDYIHVMDLANSHFLAIDYLINSSSQYISLNIGTGIGTSVLELINIFQKVNNVKIPYSFSNRRKGDNAILFSENNKASLLLNWKPKKTIEDMCRDGWRWQINNPNGYKA